MRFLLLLLTSLFANTFMLAQGFVWAKTFGDKYDEYGLDIATDSKNNVYTVGRFNGIIDFDTGPDTNQLIYTGRFDGFIHKLDAAGNFVWVKQITTPNIGGYDPSDISSIAIGKTDNIYAGGSFNGKFDFDPSSDTFYLSSIIDNSIILKLDSSGSFLWAKQLSGISAGNGCRSVSLDDSENIYIGGPVFSAGFYLSKRNSNGDSLWQKWIGNTGGVTYSKTCADGNGNTYTTGWFTDTIDFDPGIGTSFLFPTTSFSNNGFLLKLDANGEFVWVKHFEGYGVIQIYDIVPDQYDQLYLTGTFGDSIDFDLGPGKQILDGSAGAGDADIFVLKIDNDANLIWVKKIGDWYPDAGHAIDVDPFGNIYISGNFNWWVDFDPGTGTDSLFANRGNMFIVKMDSMGNEIWAKQVNATPQAITLDNENNICITGGFKDSDFDPSENICHMVSSHMDDFFILKLSYEPVSVFPAPAKTNYSIYPNPTNGLLNVLAADNIERIIVRDITGRCVYVCKPTEYIHSFEIKTPGIYFITIYTAQMATTSKIIVR